LHSKLWCRLPQFKKADVNGENELPLYTWLKSQKGFTDFDADNKIAPILIDMFDKSNPDWRKSPDIKWNFTKFLINRQGNIVERFEPTKNLKIVEEAIKAQL
jgi:glutathione peroxidase